MAESNMEHWAYAGLRLFKGKASQAWITDSGNGDELWYPAKGIYTVGSVYEVDVTREGETVRRGRPMYAYRASDREKIMQWEALDITHRAEQERIRRERKEGSQRALDDALEPLVKLARAQRTGAQRDAFTAYVLRKLAQEW